MRGPYTSPYHVGSSFSHLVLTATGEYPFLLSVEFHFYRASPPSILNTPHSLSSSHSFLLSLARLGIGITPSLAVGAQFPGNSRTKILIWSCKCAKMLKFFAPLFVDFHMIMIYYTGNEKLSVEDARRIRLSNGKGNVFLRTSRGDLTNAISGFTI